MTTQDQIIALADELGGEVRLDYSGRGMFGARCMGIVCEDSEQVILNALGRGLPRGKVDSMGKRAIVYWPGIQAAGKVATVPACPAGEHTPGPWTVGLDYDGAPLIVEYQCRDICRVDSRDGVSNARLIARAPDLLADNERLRAALTSFIETWDALPDECRRAANGATNFGRLITTLRAALLGKEGA